MSVIRKLIQYVKPYRKLAALALAFLTVQVFIDLAIPRLIELIIDQGVKTGDLAVVVNTALIMLGLSVLSTLIAIGNNNFSVRVGEAVARDLREAVFLKIQEFSYANLDAFSTGKLMVRLTSDATAVQRLTQVSLRIGTRGPLLIIGSLILMVNTSPRLALGVLPILLVTLAVLAFFSVKMEPLFGVVQQKLDRLNTVLQENVAGARLVKAFVRADREAGRFDRANRDLTGEMTRVMQLMAAMTPALTLLINAGIVLIVWLGGLQAIASGLTVGQMVAFTNYLMTTMTPLLLMTMLSNVWANGQASMRRILEVIETDPEVREQAGAVDLPEPVRGRVEFRNVSFHYSGSNDGSVLRGIDLTAEPGQTVAILGATGSGKSTLVNLIPRFYDATAGQVLIDGVDVRRIRQDSLLAHIGLVPQESILFSGSVRDNIRYGRPDASDEEVIAAARAAEAHDFITRLPDGYDTHVEERGANFSGGQKQRLAIARALVMQPRILILDDATSSVDIETETRIQAALEGIMRGRTSFVVAQRISTVLNADKIVVLDRGRVAAAGTHAELMRTSPIYQEIYESQLGAGLPVEAEAEAEAPAGEEARL